MIEVKPQYVMNRQKVADALHGVLDTGLRLLEKENYKPEDHAKMKVMRTMGTHMNAAVSMVQQETAMVRAHLVSERMKQLGYNGEMDQIEIRGPAGRKKK